MARLFLIEVFALCLSLQGSCQQRLIKADSLFSTQQYTQALDIYESYLEQGTVSQSMLLKMAFVEDASGNFELALYYLNLYYLTSADRAVVGKIEEIVSEEGLVGYNYDDTSFIISMVKKFRQLITLLIVSLNLLVLAYIYKKRRKGEKPIIGFVLQIILLVTVMGMINLDLSKEGIIITDQTLLRAGPSAGAEPVKIIGRGHKVDVLDISEPWTKIKWEGEEVYVRNDRIRII